MVTQLVRIEIPTSSPPVMLAVYGLFLGLVRFPVTLSITSEDGPLFASSDFYKIHSSCYNLEILITFSTKTGSV